MARIIEVQTGPALSRADAPDLWGERSLREKAEDLLSVADSVTREGWGDAVAAHLRQAAQDLLRLVPPEGAAG